MAEDTQRQECPHDDDLEIRPRTGTIGISEDGVPVRNIVSPYEGGVRSLPGATGNCLPGMVTTTPVSPANGPQLGPWRVAVVRVEETPAGGASGAESPCAETDQQGPIDPPEVAGNGCPALLDAPPPSRAGLMNFVGPAGLSSHAEKTRETIQFMVHTQTDSAGRFFAAGTLSPSDCYPVGPVGPYATGGPVGPDVYITDLNSLKHAVRIPPDPDGQDAAATGTPSPSDCYPAGPVGPYVAGGFVGLDDCLPILESCEYLVPNHADPVGQQDAELDTAELLEYVVVENILDGRPMKGITLPELLEYSIRLLDSTLDGGLERKISDWEPEPSPVPDANLDSRLMEGITNLEHSVSGVSLDSGPMEGMLCPEPSEQSVPNSCVVARAIEGVAEEVLNHKPVINPVHDSTPDGQLREGMSSSQCSEQGR